MFCPDANIPEFDFDENFIDVVDYKVLGKLPNPFLMDSGEIADTPEKWRERRKEIYKTAIDLQYGTQPPEPEFLEVEPVCYGEGYEISFEAVAKSLTL